MKVTLERTARLVEVGGATARIWEGKTEGGVAVTAIVLRVEPVDQRDMGSFIAEASYGADAR